MEFDTGVPVEISHRRGVHAVVGSAIEAGPRLDLAGFLEHLLGDDDVDAIEEGTVSTSIANHRRQHVPLVVSVEIAVVRRDRHDFDVVDGEGDSRMEQPDAESHLLQHLACRQRREHRQIDGNLSAQSIDAGQVEMIFVLVGEHDGVDGWKACQIELARRVDLHLGLGALAELVMEQRVDQDVGLSRGKQPTLMTEKGCAKHGLKVLSEDPDGV